MMWESVLKQEQLEIQVNPERKSIRFQLGGAAAEEDSVVILTQSEMFELMHTFLSINRTFNKETMYFEDPSIAG
ncbi:hypothetical protein LJK88_29935 [Paenibacillus sp. P26]|nr:hypothetical protein LJK88_29935 [Paenibacillus sp. P26]UUZ94503.1 hypothetical protein LJK87_08135 [Paenibacillus sp. P25]